jgi:hypothetical protein
MRRGRRDPDDLRVGDALDFWRVEMVEPGRLVRLRAEMKVPGRAWLEFQALPEPAVKHCSRRRRSSSRKGFSACSTGMLCTLFTVWFSAALSAELPASFVNRVIAGPGRGEEPICVRSLSVAVRFVAIAPATHTRSSAR